MSDDLVTLVILNHNTCALLASCLQSAQNYAPRCPIVVVDNASRDDSVALVRANFPHVRLIANPQNIGFARAMNLGIATTTTPFVFALNADTELLPMTVPSLLSAAQVLPRAGILGPVQISKQGVPLASAFADPTLVYEAIRLLLFSDVLAAKFKWGPWRTTWGDVPVTVDWLMGAALFFRRECLDAVGGFDEAQFMYGEDWDICYRARRHGWQVYLVPTAQIIHHENASARAVLGQERWARVLEAQLYFHEKHFGKASRRKLALLYYLGANLRMLGHWLGERVGLYPPTRWQAFQYQARVAWRAWAE